MKRSCIGHIRWQYPQAGVTAAVLHRTDLHLIAFRYVSISFRYVTEIAKQLAAYSAHYIFDGTARSAACRDDLTPKMPSSCDDKNTITR